MVNVLAILLAGGAGERLYPLTRDTAKPGVPFGGVYRIIDFTLSNCVNSNVRRIFILTQYNTPMHPILSIQLSSKQFCNSQTYLYVWTH